MRLMLMFEVLPFGAAFDFRNCVSLDTKLFLVVVTLFAVGYVWVLQAYNFGLPHLTLQNSYCLYGSVQRPGACSANRFRAVAVYWIRWLNRA
jgi:hypothetical protein